MGSPENLRYAASHEWLAVEADGATKKGTVGITDFAVKELTDVVYLELPEIGKKFAAGERFGIVESVKAVSELYAPVSLEVTAVNTKLPEQLTWLSEDPYQQGWIIKGTLTQPDEVEKLLTPAAYDKQCAEGSH